MSRRQNLNTSNFHLPYNPQLVARAKEMRKNTTPAENKLWQDYLRGFPLRILRQRPIDHFIVDFYCAALKLVIEVDGDTHFTEEGQLRDRQRTEVLEGYGLKVIRFTNDEVMNQFEGVCEQIQGLIPPSLLKVDPP
jgi:very-short-patch-repair endonuclease